MMPQYTACETVWKSLFIIVRVHSLWNSLEISVYDGQSTQTVKRFWKSLFMMVRIHSLWNGLEISVYENRIRQRETVGKSLFLAIYVNSPLFSVVSARILLLNQCGHSVRGFKETVRKRHIDSAGKL